MEKLLEVVNHLEFQLGLGNWSRKKLNAMKRKLDTRFPAVRIKKIMQADEDVGKIAMAVPLLVSKALELFLQDLCDRTYEITINKGAKTVNSLHLKQCVRSFNSFDFLKDTVSKVHDLGGSDAVTDDKSTIKKRKFSEDEDDNNDESGRVRMHEAGHVSSNRRGRGRPRGRGHGRSSRALEREMVVQYKETEEATQSSHQNDENQKEKLASHDYVAVDADPGTTSREDEDKLVRNFDLNVELNANDDSTPPAAAASVPSEPSSKPFPVVKYEDIPGWPVDHVERIAIDPIQLANLNIKMDEEDEDYDEE